MITGKDAWDFLKNHPHKLPTGYGIYYRSTKYSEWFPASYHWCIFRDYFYQNGENTGKHSYEACITVDYPDNKYGDITYFLWELNEFDFLNLGIDYVDVGRDI